MKLKYVQEVTEEVMKILEDINFQDYNKTGNQKRVNKAYDRLFDFRKEIIKEQKRRTKDEQTRSNKL
jgi:hypothetical protein